MAEADLSRIVNLIMENPSLVEEIKGLAEKENTAIQSSESVAEAESAEMPTYKASEADTPRRARRTELLKALKPYISSERGKAIETMIGIADMLDMMRRG